MSEPLFLYRYRIYAVIGLCWAVLISGASLLTAASGQLKKRRASRRSPSSASSPRSDRSSPGIPAGGRLPIVGQKTVKPKPSAPQASPPKQLFTGKVVLLRDAFQRRGIKASQKEIAGQVVLETPAGELIPIVPDWRGRAFFQDARLRNRKVDLVGYRRKGVPYLQVLMIFVYNNRGEREYMDYWCDICSIPMYEIKPCECCQGPIRLRFQKRPLPAYLQLPPKSVHRQTKPSAGKTSPAKDR